MARRPFTTSYDDCRTDFRSVAVAAGSTELRAHPIEASGPDDLELTIDVAVLGSARPTVALVLMAGVHGVEGFGCAPIMCDALDRWSELELPEGVGIVAVHGVNPWGMAWWRRQNESNVDLNRNWGTGADAAGPDNPGYELLHPHLCPDGNEPPDADSFLSPSRRFVDEHGEAWVRAAVSNGQSTHPLGLYYAGTEPEASTVVMGEVAAEYLSGTREVVVVDLHTGFGAMGDMTLLARHPLGSQGDRWTRDAFPDVAVHNTVSADGPEPRHGQIATGMAEHAPDAVWHTVTAELGTRSDITMILAERAEHWVHRHGDRADPTHAAIVDHHLRCSTPASPDWQAAAIEHGRSVIDAALAATLDAAARTSIALGDAPPPGR